MAHTLSSDSQLSTRRASLPTRCRSTRLYRPRFHWPTSSGRKIGRGHVEGREGGKRRDLSIPSLLLSCYIRRDNVSSRVETQAPRPKPLSSLLFLSCPSLFLVVDAYIMVQRVTCGNVSRGREERRNVERRSRRARASLRIDLRRSQSPAIFVSLDWPTISTFLLVQIEFALHPSLLSLLNELWRCQL